jgi:CRISPR-associated protein Csx17
MPDVALPGCRTQPLMGYLKALGVLRLVATADREARLWWDPAGHAILRSSLDEDGLIDFFLTEYRPSPITSPWNGGSGYYPKDKASGAALALAEGSEDDRLVPLRDTIRLARSLLGELGITEAPKGEAKERLLVEWRARASDGALEWLDATMVLRDDGPSMNPLLGTGGNDGRLEFSANFLGRLAECLPGIAPATDERRSRGLLEDALYGSGTTPLGTTKIGMFAPGLSGLPNCLSTSRSAEDASLLNPWDLVLMLEGSMAFAGGVGRRLTGQAASFPFTARDRAANRVGRSMAGEDTRGEVWLPLWPEPARLGAVGRLLAEGRAQDGRDQATTSNSLARAIGTLGVDRGVTEFERVVFANRSGRSFVAVPVDRVRAHASAVVDAQRGAQDWLSRLRGARITGLEADVRRVDLAAQACIAGRPGSAERWLLAVGALERRVAAAQRHFPDRVPRPLQGLSAPLLDALPLEDPEVRLAVALGQLRTPVDGPSGGAPAVRAVLEPVEGRAGRLVWSDDSRRPAVSVRDPLAVLQVVARTAGRGGAGPARLADVRLFLDGDLDPGRIVALAFAATLCEPVHPVPGARPLAGDVDRLYAAAHLVARAGVALIGTERVQIGAVPTLVPVLAGGGVRRAAQLVVTRLTTDGLNPFRAIGDTPRSPRQAALLAAALAFPLTHGDTAEVQRCALHPESIPEGSHA